MPDDLNPAIALATQSLDELLKHISLEDLARLHFGPEPKRARIAELLKKLNSHVNTIKRALSAAVSDGTGPPILTLPSAHRNYWNERLAPNATTLQRAYFEISGLGVLAELLDYPSAHDKPRTTMLRAVSWGLERWCDMLDEDELFEWLDRGFDIEGAQEISAMPWFAPDEWSQNQRMLEPVLVDRPTTVMRDHVRYRLLEIYRAFTFGLWMSAIALSRSLVEFSLRTNAPRFNVSITRDGQNGRPEEKSLKRLGEDIAVHVPEVARPVEIVRETGNRILHPKKHDVIAHPKVMRSEALGCIRAARQVVEAVYSEYKPR